MNGLLADVNIEGHVDVLVQILRQPPYDEFWDWLRISSYRFVDFGLPANALDIDVWTICQRERLVLLTGNRNEEDPTSLETAIRTMNTNDSLPVVTIGDVDRFLHDRDYATETANRLMEYLIEIEQYVGTGRLYVP